MIADSSDSSPSGYEPPPFPGFNPIQGDSSNSRQDVNFTFDPEIHSNIGQSSSFSYVKGANSNLFPDTRSSTDTSFGSSRSDNSDTDSSS